MSYDYGIYIFRKDLRIDDNRGLLKLNKICKKIIPIFIFDPYQVDKNNINKNYLSFPALRFLCESVKDLSLMIKKKKSKLYIFYGNPLTVIKYIIKFIEKNEIIKNSKICFGFNADFTSYSLKRDNDIITLLNKLVIEVIANDDDFTLCDMELLKKDKNSPYKQYGAFRKNMLENIKNFNKPNYNKINFIEKEIKFNKLLDENNLDEFWLEFIDKNYSPLETGSRQEALNIFNNLQKFKEYNVKRDTLSWETTHLSAYLNFGLISEREFYFELVKKLGKSNQLINQVIWRDYYLCLLRFLPYANSYVRHVDPRYDKLSWITKIPDKKSKDWKEWDLMMNSKTGFLIVDAAVQEIKKSGYMHNRCRMIVGVFSVKYLGINPLCRYIGLNDWFSRHLLDCSTSQNKLNTQWVTELDFPGKKFSPSQAPISGRPMNISNEMIKKWDPECKYIKKWLPKLSEIDNKIIYNWNTKYDVTKHPAPIFDPKDRYKQWINMCSKVD